MDAIMAARALGRAIQEDDRYLSLALASQRCEEDELLQEKIAIFEKKRIELDRQLQESEGNRSASAGTLSGEVKELYSDIMQSESMARFNAARTDMQKMMGFINQIVSGSAEGADPDLIEHEQGCGGGCGSCGGCN